MNIQLPNISGLEVAKIIKADDDLKNIPVIAVTASAMKDDEKKIQDAGCEGYISKPISIPKFMESINTFLSWIYSPQTSPTTSCAPWALPLLGPSVPIFVFT